MAGTLCVNMERINPWLEEPKRKEGSFFEKDILVFTDVYDYLKLTDRENLCLYDRYACEKWTVEPKLIRELESLHGSEQPDLKKIGLVRGIIRALSNFPPNRDSDAEVLSKLSVERKLKEGHWKEIENILKNKRTGEEIEGIVRQVEREYNSLMLKSENLEDGPAKDQLRGEIDRLRPVRDRLYLHRVHEKQAKGATFANLPKFTPARPRPL